MKKLLLSTLLVLFTVTAWAQSTALRGVVVDAKTQQPLFNVTANLSNTNLSATTNQQGEFEIATDEDDLFKHLADDDNQDDLLTLEGKLKTKKLASI